MINIEVKQEVTNSTLFTRPCRHLRLSEPEFRALKKLAQISEKTLDEEIFHALERWEKACGKETDLSFWSETEPRFRCLHDLVELRYFSDSEPELIEAAIRRHIHDFGSNPEHETNAGAISESLIVTLRMDGLLADRLWAAKRTTGRTLGSFVEDAIMGFISYLSSDESSGIVGAKFEDQKSGATKPRRIMSTQTFHISLNKKLVGELCKILQFNRREIERAVIMAINWRLVRPCLCSLQAPPS